MPRLSFPAPLALAFALAAVPAAHAADPPKPAGAKVSGFGNKGGPLLTRNELRACLQRSDRIRSDAEALQKERGTLDAEGARLAEASTALKAELAALDRTSEPAVQAYVAKATAHDQSVDAYGAATGAYNQRVQALQSERQAFGTACDNRRYDEADEIAIRKGR